MEPHLPEKKIRINKYLAASGICSRREADRLIASGAVTIDGVPAALGEQVLPGQSVCVNHKRVFPRGNTLFLLFYKPVGITCTTDHRRPDNIIDFLGFHERIFPVGRLDRDSEGLVLLTNDGSVVNRILRPHNAHEKAYRVTVDKPVTDHFLKQMAEGVAILNTVTKPCRVIREDDHVFQIILTQGINRQIRRMCAVFDYQVTRLIRVRIMHLSIGSLKPGQYRLLTQSESDELYRLVRHSDPRPFLEHTHSDHSSTDH